MTKLRFIILLSLSALFIGCKKEYDINNVYNKILIMGHGGMGHIRAPYPTNSFESVEAAKTLGADGSELDIQMTKDSVLVCYHDYFLEEATNFEGEIYTKTWDEIKDAEYRTVPYEVYKLMSLEQAFKQSENSDFWFTLDLKLRDPNTTSLNRAIFQRAIIRLIEKYNMENRVTIESTDLGFLKTLKTKKEGLNLFLYTDFETALEGAVDNGFQGITVRTSEVTSEQILQAHSFGILVAVFGARVGNHDETITKNPDIIQTDDLEHLIAILK